MRTRLIQIVWGLLTLVSLWVFGYSLYWLYTYFQHLPAGQLETLAIAGMSVDSYLALNFLNVAIIYLSFFVIAQLIMLRRAREDFTLLAAVVLLAFGTGNAGAPMPGLFESLYSQPAAFVYAYAAFNFLGWTLIAVFLLTYPDGRFFPRRSIWLALFTFIVSVVWTTNPDAFSKVQGIWAILLLLITSFGYGSILYTQVWRYRHYYSPIQKQQVKWFVLGVLGILVSVVPTVILYPRILAPDTPSAELLTDELLYLIGSTSLVILPLAVGIAILRYRLWDIDILIRKTLTYAIVAALLAVIYFGSVILLQQIFAQLTGQRSEVTTVLSTLAIAALFIPLRNRIQDLVDRRFYRKKYDAQQVLNDFAQTVRDETDLEKLTGRLMQVVDETMQPKSVSVWLRDEVRKDG